MNRSLTDRVEFRRHLQGTFTATQTPPAGVDLLGLHSAEICVNVGTVADLAAGSWTLALQHSDESGANFAAVEESDVALPDGVTLGANGVFATLDSAEHASAVYRLGYVGVKRYVRVVATATGTPGNSVLDAFVVGEKSLAI